MMLSWGSGVCYWISMKVCWNKDEMKIRQCVHRKGKDRQVVKEKNSLNSLPCFILPINRSHIRKMLRGIFQSMKVLLNHSPLPILLQNWSRSTSSCDLKMNEPFRKSSIFMWPILIPTTRFLLDEPFLLVTQPVIRFTSDETVAFSIHHQLSNFRPLWESGSTWLFNVLTVKILLFQINQPQWSIVKIQLKPKPKRKCKNSLFLGLWF